MQLGARPCESLVIFPEKTPFLLDESDAARQNNDTSRNLHSVRATETASRQRKH
jgi:hypothetical protein